ncbi:MAG: tetratricopeptide repeat protein [Pirellulales bacterium]|nr:tetratricopeptide repeat protein [Pirellulales bacterium]
MPQPLDAPQPDSAAPQSSFATREELDRAVAACGSDVERIDLCSRVASDPLAVPEVVARAQELLQQLQPAVEADRLASEACELLAAHQADAARKKLKEANKLAPERPRAIFLLGLIEALEFRDTAEAQRAFKEALKRAPKNAATMNNLAIIELRLGHVAVAINYFKGALAEAPGMSQAVNNLRRLAMYANRGRFKLKKRELEQLNAFCQQQGGRDFDGSAGWLYVDTSAAGGEPTGLRVAMNTEWQAWSAHACLGCGGLGAIDCPVRGCSEGKVRARQAVGAAGFTPQGGSVDRRVPCDYCNGTGKVSCPWCNGDGQE